ncbi:MAG: ABC transporter permease [Planctomycetota bacterium]|jgi:putative ABC transport system permease protein
MTFRLVFRNLLAHPWRTSLTLASMLVAVFLLCLLRAGVAGLTTVVEGAATNRLLVQSAVSLFVDLPLAYEGKVRNVDGVEWVCKWQWFGGIYQEESFFAQYGIDPETFLQSYPELHIADGSYQEFQQTRTGCLIGQDLANKFGWQVGDRVPIKSGLFPRSDDSAWDFTVKGIYRSKTTSIDQQSMFFHFDYLREAQEQGAALGEPAVGVYMLKLAPGTNPTTVMAAVDLLFENGPQRVQTTTEAEFNRQFITMMGNIPLLLNSIGGAVLFAVFFAVLNTMLMAGRQRTRDIGVMKALGFGNGAVFRSLLTESLLLCGIGGLLGIGLARAAAGALQPVVSRMLPGFEIGAATMVVGVGISLGVGLIAGVVPGWYASRLAPVAALREEA